MNVDDYNIIVRADGVFHVHHLKPEPIGINLQHALAAVLGLYALTVGWRISR